MRHISAEERASDHAWFNECLRRAAHQQREALPMSEMQREVIFNMTETEYRVFREMYNDRTEVDEENSYATYEDAINDACFAAREAVRLFPRPMPEYTIKREAGR